MTFIPAVYWVIGLSLLLLGGAGPLLAYRRWPPIQTPALVPILVGLLAGATLTAVLLVKAPLPWGRDLVLIAVLGQFVPALLAYGVAELPMLVFNGGLDPSLAVPTRLVIHEAGERTAAVRIAEGPFQGTAFAISRSKLPADGVGFHYRTGEALTLMLHPGRLGYPWWESLRASSP